MIDPGRVEETGELKIERIPVIAAETRRESLSR